LTTILSQLQTPNLEECRTIPTTNLYLKVVPRWNGTVSDMKHQVSKEIFLNGAVATAEAHR